MKRRTFIKLGAAGTATLFLPMSFLQICQRKMASATLDLDQPVYGLAYFSGIAVYSGEITTPSDLLPDGKGKTYAIWKHFDKNELVPESGLPWWAKL